MLGEIKLVYHIDGDGANLVDSMDLLNFAQGFELADGGWIPQVAAGDGIVTETLTFRAKATSNNNLATRFQVLDDWITRVNYYRSSEMRTAVWLRVKVDNESEYRQALVSSLSYQIGSSPFGATWQINTFVDTIALVIERAAFWEEITPQSDALTAFNYLSDTLSAITGGDTTARLWKTSSDASAAARQNTVWFGFKNDRYFNPALFEPRRPLTAYEAGAGTNTTFGDDITAMSGRVARTTFGTTTLVQRHTLPVSMLATWDGITITRTTLTSDYIRGEYLCLMRALAFENLSAPTIRARIRVGYSSASTGDKIYPRVVITSPDWHLYEMGVITLPLDRSSANNTVFNTAIKLDAELVSGDGFLYVDGYILIPLDGASRTYSDDGIVSGVGALARNALVEVNPLREVYGYTIDGLGAVYDVAAIEPFDWGVPQTQSSPCILVGASDADASDTLVTTAWSADLTYFRRWRTLRGAES